MGQALSANENRYEQVPELKLDEELEEAIELEGTEFKSDQLDTSDDEINLHISPIEDDASKALLDVGIKEAIHESTESFLSITIQIFLPFVVAGFGMVVAGLVLDVVQHWEVFENITDLFILVPALLGLKGNLVRVNSA